VSAGPVAATARPGHGGALAACPIGVVPIVWNNADLLDLAPEVPYPTVLDEIARLGYAGCQLGRGFPSGDELRRELERRGLRLAEVYAELACTREGPEHDALSEVRQRLQLLDNGGGDVLVVALGDVPEREAAAGRATSAGMTRLTADGWARLADCLHALAVEARADGHRLAFHPHAGTFVETPDEVERLMGETVDPVQLCLDVGHCIVGGGDPAAAVRRYAGRLGHMHVKDVDGAVLRRLADGELPGFIAAVRERIFTELGNGLLDLSGLLGEVDAARYRGWLMVEQDSSWLPASEAAAVGRRVLGFALAELGRR
jgi:inosose dehydratase